MRNGPVSSAQSLTQEMPRSEFESHYESPAAAEQAYAKMKIGLRSVDDAIVDLSAFKKVDRNAFSKDYILQALARKDYRTLRRVSNEFFEISGLYAELCKYLATIFRYDWYITPYVEKSANQNKVLNDFSKVLDYLDNSEIKRLCNLIALDVIKNGVYYGIAIDLGDKFTIQELPADYCRSRFKSGLNPVVELNMRFFDAYFSNPQYRVKVLQTFPKDIQKAYVMYKEGKLPGDYPDDGNGWYALEPGVGFKFNLNGSDCPSLVNTIPSILDLDEAQALDRKKVMQQLLKIIIQKLPLDKNSDLVFDVDEAKDIHNNAVAMLKRAVGVDVLTTFADVDVADMSDSNSSTTTDDLERVERTVYNNAGVSQNLFNTEGNVALEKSVLNDEASMKDLVYQFQSLLNAMVKKFNRVNHYTFRVSILETTTYNHKDMSKLYKEQTQIGNSKILPQVALGHSQSSIIATATFENNILHLADIMIPPMSSNTMSSSTKSAAASSSGNSTTNSSSTEQGTAGRPEKENDQKSEKTIANRESMGKEG